MLSILKQFVFVSCQFNVEVTMINTVNYSTLLLLIHAYIILIIIHAIYYFVYFIRLLLLKTALIRPGVYGSETSESHLRENYFYPSKA
jgi:hypothetical protein